MAQSLQRDFFMEIEVFINQSYSSAGIFPTNLNPVKNKLLNWRIFDYMQHHSVDVRDSDGRPVADLYLHIKTCLQNKVDSIYTDINRMEDKEICRLYKRHWDNYRVMCDFMSYVFHPANQHRDQLDGQDCDYFMFEGNVCEVEVRDLTQQTWEERFFTPLFPNIKRICLKLIKIHRNNHLSDFDAQSIKNILQLYSNTNFIEIIKKDQQFNSINDFYLECFEQEFLKEAQDFYRQKKPPFEPNQMLVYLRKADNDLKYEKNLAGIYLPKDKTTLEKLINEIEDIYIPDDTLNNIVGSMMLFERNPDKYEELTSLYELINRMPKIKNKLHGTECRTEKKKLLVEIEKQLMKRTERQKEYVTIKDEMTA